MINSFFLFVIFINGPCRDLYLNKILASQNTSQYYLVATVQTGGKKNEILVLNLNLYSYLKEQNKQLENITYYKNWMKEKLSKNEPITIGRSGVRKMGAILIKEDTFVKVAANRGKEYFLNRFFNISSQNTYARLKQDVPEREISQIVEILFKWGYLIEMVEGDIQISLKNICEGN